VNKDAVLAQIRTERLIALIDADVSSDLVRCAEALSRGGINTAELTLTTPAAIAALKSASQRLPEFCFGLGTVIDVDTAQRGILAGASFVATPETRTSVITLCRRYHVPVIVSAFTREEVAAAHSAGADAVKVFPGEHVGPAYIESLATKFPSLLMIPIGGITARSLPEFLRSGAAAAFVGSSLVDDDTWRAKNWSAITENARKLAGSLPLLAV
jgi:2-dehydro-3-deoxyphosphogluconate aldolase/(4S)-4-hydroxy-2-oxoglutarate aldolase